MKNRMLFSVLFVAFFSFLNVSNINAQDKDKTIKEIKSKDVIKTRNYNPHIQVLVPKSDDDPTPAPNKKGGENDDAAIEYEVIIDNFTGFYVEVYIDGVYKGTIGDWGTLNISVNEAYKKVYCITTGGTKDWLITGEFEEDYIWKLMN